MYEDLSKEEMRWELIGKDSQIAYLHGQIKTLEGKVHGFAKEAEIWENIYSDECDNSEMWNKIRSILIDKLNDIHHDSYLHLELKDEYQIGERTIEILKDIMKTSSTLYDIVFDQDKKLIDKLYKK